MTDARWTGEQVRAITSGGHTLLEANAGTGKTTTVVGAILWRLGVDIGGDETGRPVPPCPPSRVLRLEQIAAITFTEKAAYDLKRKLRSEIEARVPQLLWDLDRAAIGTIHSFCGDLLRDQALRFGLDPGFSTLDERETALELETRAEEVIVDALMAGDETVMELVQCFGRARDDHKKGTAGFLLDVHRDRRWHHDRWAAWTTEGSLDAARLKRLAPGWSEPDDLPVAQCAALARLSDELDRRWAAWLADEHARDFDALILDTRRLLTDPRMRPALDAIRRRFGLLVIDEFQDTDGAQRDIAFHIVALDGPAGDGPTLFLVGDPKQSIYRFRHADVNVWNEVSTRFERDGLAVLPLTHNFRSAPPVVEFVNRTCAPAFARMGTAVEHSGLASCVEYRGLVPARSDRERSAVEQLVSGGKAHERRTLEADMVAARIRDFVVDEAKGDRNGIEIVDPATGTPRWCRYADIAVLFRTRTPVTYLTPALEEYGVPYYLAGDAGLIERMEILDALTLLRVLENPLDDLRVFAFLRSPFVGLRDEVIARIRLDAMHRPLIHAARDYAATGEWFPAPEHGGIAAVEQESLRNGVRVVDELSRLPSRVPIHRLAEEAIERTGYRLHLLLHAESAGRLANLERFIALLEGFRNHTVGTFLEVWEHWADRDLGIPQAPLYSRKDNVVTLSTIHSAKGLEWPVVFYVDTHAGFSDHATGEFWHDRDLGPVLCPKQDERGVRTARLADRWNAEDEAEEARVLYVAATRARDRLVVAVPSDKPKGAAAWLAAGIDASVVPTRAVPDVEKPPPPPEPGLEWLDAVVPAPLAPSSLAAPVRAGRLRRFRSATEVMARLRSRAEWRAKYVYGIEPTWWFARQPTGDGGHVPAAVRGIVIHGVLERIREESELAELLDVAIGALDAPELEERLGPGTTYRRALETELQRVVSSDEWRWYTEGDHWRELWFVNFRRGGTWHAGAFDLFRPGDPRSLIVDFKTHGIAAAEVDTVARDYAVQIAMYRCAAAAAGTPADVRLHFTGPGVVWGPGQRGDP
jgi:ATP-dependent exoDNAse (exonuclease V) beta subunit